MTKAHHAGQKPTTIWMPEQLAEQLDRKLADAAQPGLRPSRSGFILHAIQSALGGAAAAPPALGPTAPAGAPTVQPVAPAQPVQAAEPAQAAAEAREDKAAAKAARAAQRAAKKTAPAAEPAPQQLQPEQPEPLASPFGAGPSES